MPQLGDHRRHVAGRYAARLPGAAVLVACLLVTTACADRAEAAGPVGRLTVLATGRPVRPNAAPPKLTVTPAPDAAGVSVTDPVTVTVENAMLDQVSLTGPDGMSVAGEVAAD